MIVCFLKSRSGLLAAALALCGLLSTAGRVWADDEPLGGERRMRQEAIHKVQEAGASFVPPSGSAASASAASSATAPVVKPKGVRRVTALSSTGPRCLPTCATNDGRF